MVILGADPYHMNPFIVGKWTPVEKCFDIDDNKVKTLNEIKSTNICFLYDDYIHKETKFDDTFLKIKTFLFIIPDFMKANNLGKWENFRQLRANRKSLFYKEY